MIGLIERFMTEDHAGIDRLLADAEHDDGTIDDELYSDFRRSLLRHIAMEEKVLLPLCRDVLPTAAALRADHGRIAKLLVRTPTPELLDAIRTTLAKHNALEEGPDGLYATCDAIADAAVVLPRLRAMPRVPLAKYYDGPSHQR